MVAVNMETYKCNSTFGLSEHWRIFTSYTNLGFASVCILVNIRQYSLRLQVLLYTSIPIKEQCVFICLSVFFLSATRHFLLCGAASESESRSRRGRPGARGQACACTARARARMPYNFSTKKSYTDAFQKENRTRAHVVVYVTVDKKK